MMRKTPHLIIGLLFFVCGAKAQQNAAEPAAASVATSKKIQPAADMTQPYGVVDTADLKLTACDFEKEADAEILFDKAHINMEEGKSMERHIRIKIFNDFGKQAANVRLIYRTEFLGGKGYSSLEGETITLEDGKIIKTPLTDSGVYKQKIDKNFSAIVFTLPNVKVGSIIEYKYKSYPSPEWFFQGILPTRYSEMSLHAEPVLTGIVRNMWARAYVNQKFFIDTFYSAKRTMTWALSNIHSLPNEPYMTARRQNLERLQFTGLGLFGSWNVIAGQLLQQSGFDLPQERILPGQEGILKKSDELISDEQKIAFLFDTVRNAMKWNGQTFLFSTSSLAKAWENKSGNSGEINLLLLHFLKVIGINAYPMEVSTREYGRIDPVAADPYAINNTVVYIPIDPTHAYILDASKKYNLYNDIPFEILDTYGVQIFPDTKKTKLIALTDESPVMRSTSVDAEIKPDGKMTGGAEITSAGYYKTESLKLYNRLDQKTYLDSAFLLGRSVSIDSFKIANMDVDSIPLSQTLHFATTSTGSDDGYIYFKTNLFSITGDNPFKSEDRFSDIDLGFRGNHGMNGIYKIPAGYKIESMPKSITIIMPDQSIVFKRTVAADNGTILVRYSVNHKKTIYYAQEYQNLRGFYKQMYDLLNEQVVLKKQ